MDQRTSGFRVWVWGVYGLFLIGALVLVTVFAGDGYRVSGFNPQLLLILAFFLALGVGIYMLDRGNHSEEKEDLP